MKKAGQWALTCVPVLILVLIASEAIHFQRQRHVEKEADAAAHQFLVSLLDHQYSAAYAMLDAEEKQKLSPASMQKQIQGLDGLDWVPPSCDEYHPNGSLTRVVLSYSVELGKEGLPMRIEMTQTPDGWRVGYYRFNESPA